MNSLNAFHVTCSAMKPRDSPTPTKLEQSFLKTPCGLGAEHEDSWLWLNCSLTKTGPSYKGATRLHRAEALNRGGVGRVGFLR